MLMQPVISTNLLLHEVDQEVAVQGFKRVGEFWSNMDITAGAE